MKTEKAGCSQTPPWWPLSWLLQSLEEIHNFCTPCKGIQTMTGDLRRCAGQKSLWCAAQSYQWTGDERGIAESQGVSSAGMMPHLQKEMGQLHAAGVDHAAPTVDSQLRHLQGQKPKARVLPAALPTMACTQRVPSTHFMGILMPRQ